MKPRLLGFGLAGLMLAANLWIQPLLMADVPPRILIAGLADFRPQWNPCVSFSLCPLTQDSQFGRYLLILLLVLMTLVVAWLLWRATLRLPAAAWGLILGGALGNLLDRLRYGAVFDFLALHLGGLPLFVCNLPDIFISAGVVLLLLDSLLSRPTPRST